MKGTTLADDIHGRNARITSARDGLERGDDDLLNAKWNERREGHGEHDGGAVRIGDDHAFPTAGFLLAAQQFQVPGIDLRDNERDIRFHAMIARIGNDDVTGLSERTFDFSGDPGVHGREHQARSVGRGLGIRDHDFGRGGWNVAIETPRRGVFKLLAGGAVTRAKPCEIEPRMALQETDKVLAHHSGAAENTHIDCLHYC